VLDLESDFIVSKAIVLRAVPGNRFLVTGVEPVERRVQS
jgi:hypothetical protein